jgi:hypothetical protein
MRTSIQMSEDGFGTNGEKTVSISGPRALLALLVARGEFSQLGVLNLNRGMEGLVRERPCLASPLNMSTGPFGYAQDESETPEEHYVDKEKHVVEQL